MIEGYHRFLDGKGSSKVKTLMIVMLSAAAAIVVALSIIKIPMITPTLGVVAALLMYASTEAWWYMFASQDRKDKINFLRDMQPVPRILSIVGMLVAWLVVFVLIIPYLPTIVAGTLNVFVWIVAGFAIFRGPRLTEKDMEKFESNLRRPTRRKLKQLEETTDDGV